MNRTLDIYLRLSALSIYKGILQRSVPKAFYRLLGSLESSPTDFLNAYGEFYFLLCERGYSENLAFCLTEAALFDDNCFSRNATAGNIEKLPQNIKNAVEFDCRAITDAGMLTADEVINDYIRKDEIAKIAPNLPKWKNGNVAEAFEGFDGSLNKLEQFHKANGCGMFARYQTFIWRNSSIQPVMNPDKVSIDSLKGYDYQRNLVLDNTISFIENKTCNNCLLYGHKGTGKSTTVKAVFNKLKKRGLRIVEMPKECLMDFPLLVDAIANIPMKFIIFIDDLSFQKQDESYASLKAVLEGGLTAKPDNALIYATSNRRHLVKETFDDNKSNGELHPNDSKEEGLSLSDRFGLSVCFNAPNKDKYCEIVLALAKQNNISVDENTLLAEAETFALARGGRSPRCAKQYIKSLFK